MQSCSGDVLIADGLFRPPVGTPALQLPQTTGSGICQCPAESKNKNPASRNRRRGITRVYTAAYIRTALHNRQSQAEMPRWPIAIASWKDRALLVKIAIPAMGLQPSDGFLRQAPPITDQAVSLDISHRAHPGNDR